MRRYLATFLDLLTVAAAAGTLPAAGNAYAVAELARAKRRAAVP
jgi:hypothetical protein